MDSPSTLTVAEAVRVVAVLVFVVVVLLSVGLALVFRRRYIAAVVRLQGHDEVERNEAQPPSVRSAPMLRLVKDDLTDRSPGVGATILRLRRRLFASQVACDVVFWCVCSSLCLFGPALAQLLWRAILTADISGLRMSMALFSIFLDIGDSPTSAWGNLLFGVMYLLAPPIVACAAQTAFRRKYVYLPVAGAAAIWMAEIGRASWSSGMFGGAIALAVVIGLLGGAVVFLHAPRVRGAAAPLIVALFIGVTTWMIVAAGLDLYFAGSNDDTTLSAADVLSLAVFFLLVAGTAMGALLVVARVYQRKQLSDVELAQVAFWLLTTLLAFAAGAFVNGSTSTTMGQVLGQVGLLSVWAFGIIFIRQRWRRSILRAAPPRTGGLLVLRVFKRAPQSEEFLDRLLSFWRFAAPVDFIAGPDLAGAAIEPDEFFGFIRGRLGDRFVRTPSQVDTVINGLDRERDPDGRFRVNELFCTATTWRAAVASLMAQAGVVLLDLREYKAERAGTRYEIYQLMNAVSVERIVVLIGDRDDSDAISAELCHAWDSMSEFSPNRRLAHAELRVCRLRSGSAAEVEALFTRLYAPSLSAMPTVACSL